MTAAAFAPLAQAQEKTGGLEEIVVTAERRAESLQDVSLSITAFGDEKRDIVGIQTIQDMANFAPGMSYNTSTDRPSIRGIGRQSNTFSIDSPIANYFDGVYTTSVQDASRRPIFIDRTEILRGPQGALSGRGSIGGAINTISKRPKDEFGGEVRAFGGSYSRYGLEGTLTTPVTDWWRVRVNLATYHQNEGYFENIATGRSEGDQPNNRNIQDYLMEFDLGESVDLFLKASFADYSESRRTGYSTAPYVADTIGAPSAYGTSSSVGTPLASYGYFPQSQSIRYGTNTQNPVITTGDVRKFVSDFDSHQWLDDHHNYTADLVWHAPIVDLRWIGGHQNYKYTQLQDADGTDVIAMRLPPSVVFPAGRLVYPGGINMYQEERKWYSNELTATSTTEGPFSWIFGLYQSNEDYVQTPLALIYPGYPELNNPAGGPANPYPFTTTRGTLDGNTVSSAAFSQLDYKLSDAWKFTVGLRYNKDEKEVTESVRLIGNNFASGAFLAGVYGATDVTNTLAAPAVLPGVVRDRGIDPVSGYRIRDLKGEWKALTGSAGVDYKMTEDDLLYARFAVGYRPGGFNAGFISNPPMVDKEKVNSFEVGYKTTLFDRLQLSSSVFYYDYKDIQLPLPVLGRCLDPNDISSCTVVNSFVNLPSGESRGLEIEANWAVTDSFNMFLSYGYLDAKIKDAMVPGSLGYSNTADPAAILRNANRQSPILQRTTTPCPATPGPLGCSGGFALTNAVDTGFTYLPRYTQDLSGNKMNDAPEHKVAFNANYTLDTSIGSITFSSSLVWRDESYSDVFETEESKLPSYTTVGARIIWTDVANNTSIMLYGTNLTDEEAIDGASTTRLRTGAATSAATASAAGAAYFPGYNLAPPREFGLELQYRFGAK